MSFFKRLKEKLIGGNEEKELLEQQEAQQGDDTPQLDASVNEASVVEEKTLEVIEAVQPELVIEKVEEVPEEPAIAPEEVEKQEEQAF